MVIDPEGVTVELSETGGTAVFEAEDVHIWDYGNIVNGIAHNGPPPTPAIVSFKVKWTASGPVQHFDNQSQEYRGDFFTFSNGVTAQIWYQIRTGDFDIESAPLEDSITGGLAQVGTESNGSFY